MATPVLPYNLSGNTFAQTSLLEYCKETVKASYDIYNLRDRFVTIDKEYNRENNLSPANNKAGASQLEYRGANAAGDKRKIQDIVIPIVEQQVETGVAYLTSVFLSGTPIFGVVADKLNASSALQMDAIMAENSQRGGWIRHLGLCFRDGLKYNFMAAEVIWDQYKIFNSITDAKLAGTGSKEGKPEEVMWAGNCIHRLDPYNTLFDPRVPIAEQHEKAEFVGYTKLMNRPTLMEFLHKLPWRMNVKEAYESKIPGEGWNSLYYIPQIFTNPESTNKLQMAMDWNLWAFGTKPTNDVRIAFKNIYQVVTRYIRMVPSDHRIRVPGLNQVQIWKVVTVNDSVVVYLEKQSSAHNFLPIVFGEPCEDVPYQGKSFAQKQIPMQDIASALANSRLAARRREISDRMIYDPTRIASADINSENPSAKIPIRPNAYGQPLEKAFARLDYRDTSNVSLMTDVREVQGFANSISGQNPAQQGQFVKGNKTRAEYEDVQGHASGRQNTMAIVIEAQFFVPMKEILKLNILQYQPPGKAYNAASNTVVDIKPEELRKAALTFKISDGLIPSDKIMDGATLNKALEAVASSPALAEEYNVGDIFSHLIKTRGVDIDQYKWTPEQKQQKQQMMLERIKAEGEAKQGPQPPMNPQQMMRRA